MSGRGAKPHNVRSSSFFVHEANPIGDGPIRKFPGPQFGNRVYVLGYKEMFVMKEEDLRVVQAPLKEHYLEAPDAARVTLSAIGRIGDGISCKIETGKALVVAGLHPATGGTGQAACSGDMLLEALVACAGVTLNAVATALGIELRDASLLAEGDLDFRGTLGVSKEVPVGFQDIRLQFTLETNASDEELDTLLRLTERYCVVYQTLARPPVLEISRKRAATT